MLMVGPSTSFLLEWSIPVHMYVVHTQNVFWWLLRLFTFLWMENAFLYFINEQRNKGELVTLPKDSLLSCTASPTDAQTGGIFPLGFKSSRLLWVRKQRSLFSVCSYVSMILLITQSESSKPFKPQWMFIFNVIQRVSRIPKGRLPISWWFGRGHWKVQKQHLYVWLITFSASFKRPRM